MQDDLTGKLTAARAIYQENRRTLIDRQRALRRVAGAVKDPPVIIGKFAAIAAETIAQDAHFRPQYVEPLLQQATALLDRVLAEDATYRQLRIDQLNLRLDLDELERLQAINDDEVAAGLFQVPFWDASASLESDRALKKGQTDLLALVKANADRQTRLAAWASENAQQPLGTGWEGKLSAHSVRLYGGYQPAASDLPSGAAATEGNLIGGLLSHEISTYSFAYTQQQLTSQQAPVDARAVPLEKRVTYLQADAGFRERRKIAAHQKLMDKLDAVQTPHAPLNYADRLMAIEERAARDLSEAFNRLVAVRAGLKLVYGVDAPPLPAVPALPLKDDDLNFLNRLIAWIRNVGFLLQRIYDYDQDVTLSLSVADLLKGEHFADGRKRGYWEFEIDASRFADYKLVRLRGVSAVAHSTDRVYSLSVTAPKDCDVIYGPTIARTRVSLDVDSCWLGNVAPPRSAHRPDVCGTRVLWNASPLGRWSLHLTPGTGAADLDNIELTLLLATQRLS